MCRLSRNSGASASWNPKRLSRPVAGKLYLYSSTMSSPLNRSGRFGEKSPAPRIHKIFTVLEAGVTESRETGLYIVQVLIYFAGKYKVTFTDLGSR
jgi:hypothetical protein